MEGPSIKIVAMNALVSSPCKKTTPQPEDCALTVDVSTTLRRLNEWQELQRDYTLEFQLTWLMDPQKHVWEKELPFKYAAYWWSYHSKNAMDWD